jgi:hypothetical protein
MRVEQMTFSSRKLLGVSSQMCGYQLGQLTDLLRDKEFYSVIRCRGYVKVDAEGELPK